MSKTAKIWLVVGIIVVVLACCCVVSIVAVGALGNVFNVDGIIEASRGPGSADVTLANYERVRAGMTYDEVAAIFGGPGVRTAQLELAGERLEFYTWKDTAAGQATVVFKNGRVTEKNQHGLE